MNLERVITKLLKAINSRIQQLALNITSGNIDNMEKYKYVIGQITALEAVKQELSSLLEDKEQNNGTVIDLSKRDTKA
jgi:hypothetical protein